MVSLADVERTNTARAAATAAGRPFVAVFAGGTAGIGMYGVLALARTHGQARGAGAGAGLRVYIVGRRASDALLAACARLCPAGAFVFVPAQDLGLLRDVDRVAAEIINHEQAASGGRGHIDLLVASQGVLLLGPRQETPEGLERLAALVFYGRARLVDRLLPLLTSDSADSADSARVVFVLNPTLEGALVAADLELRAPAGYALRTQAAHGAALVTLLAEALAARHAARLAVVHWFPGAVPSGLLRASPLPRWAHVLAVLATPLVRLLGTAPEECGQRLVFFGTSDRYPARGQDQPGEVAVGADGRPGSGAYRVGPDNDSLPHNAALDADRAAGRADAVYAHTMAVFAAIEGGGVWRGETKE